MKFLDKNRAFVIIILGDFEMLVNYDTIKIAKALDDFYSATGINMDLFRVDFSRVAERSHSKNNRYCNAVQNTEVGSHACNHSDITLLEKCRDTKTFQMHVCHAGLIDIAVPILYDGEIIGYIIFGQMKNTQNFKPLSDYITTLNLNLPQMEHYFNEIPVFDSNKIEGISSIATMLVKYILLENMLKPYYDETVQKAINFINENLSDDISVHTIAKGIGVSKNVIYRRFHSFFNCTVSEYINSLRVERACDLLLKSDMSVEEISRTIGFTSASYFSKTFKRQKGLSPFKYKKSFSKNILTK